MHATTVAKLEAGDRNAKIDELVGIAEVFGCSTDVLVGKSVPEPIREHEFLARQVAESLWTAKLQAEAAERDIREKTAELAACSTYDDPAELVAASAEAADALLLAVQALDKAGVSAFFTDQGRDDEEAGR